MGSPDVTSAMQALQAAKSYWSQISSNVFNARTTAEVQYWGDVLKDATSQVNLAQDALAKAQMIANATMAGGAGMNALNNLNQGLDNWNASYPASYGGANSVNNVYNQTSRSFNSSNSGNTTAITNPNVPSQPSSYLSSSNPQKLNYQPQQTSYASPYSNSQPTSAGIYSPPYYSPYQNNEAQDYADKVFSPVSGYADKVCPPSSNYGSSSGANSSKGSNIDDATNSQQAKAESQSQPEPTQSTKKTSTKPAKYQYQPRPPNASKVHTITYSNGNQTQY